jgi:hypothetical protein
MRLIAASLLFAALMPAFAAELVKEVPPPPALPAGAMDDPALEPEVTIVQKDDATITEYRIGGRLYMQKVKPKVGPEYYLIDEAGTGSFVRRDTDPKIKPPMWVIKRF